MTSASAHGLATLTHDGTVLDVRLPRSMARELEEFIVDPELPEPEPA